MVDFFHGWIMCMVVAALAGYTGVHVTTTHSEPFAFLLVELGIFSAALSRLLGSGLREILIVIERNGSRELLMNGIHPVVPGLALAALCAYMLSPAGVGCKLMARPGRLRLLAWLLGAAVLIAMGGIEPAHGLSWSVLLSGSPLGLPQPDLRLVLDVVMACALLHVLLYRNFRFVCMLSPTGSRYDRRCAYYHATLFATVALLATAGLPTIGAPAFFALLLLPARLARRSLRGFPALLKRSTLLALGSTVLACTVASLGNWPCGPFVLLALGLIWTLAPGGRKTS